MRHIKLYCDLQKLPEFDYGLPADVLIRSLTKNDVGPFSEAMNRSFEENPDAIKIDRKYIKKILDPELFYPDLVVVLERQNEIIGGLVVGGKTDFGYAMFGFLVPEARGGRLALSLLADVLRRCKDRGMKRIYCHVGIELKHVLRILQKFGWVWYVNRYMLLPIPVSG